MSPGNYYDDIHIGDERYTPGVTVTEGHILAFAGVTGNFAPAHMDEVHAKASVFGGRVAHGLLGLALADGLKVQTGFFMDGAALGWTWKFKRPIHIGDTLRAKFRITDKRIPKSRRNMGILFIAFDLINQHGEVVQEGEHQLMIPRRPELVAEEAGSNSFEPLMMSAPVIMDPTSFTE